MKNIEISILNPESVKEGKLCCGKVLGKKRGPKEILDEEFPLLRKNGNKKI